MSWRLAWLFCTCTGVLVAQELGALEGTVRDASRAIVPNATVTCSQEEEGYRFAAVTDREGHYSLTVPPGHYNLVARRSGFRAAAQLGVYVPKEGLQGIDFVLEVTPISESVTVTGHSVLAPISADDSMVLPATNNGMPQNGRTVTAIAMAAPGMLATPANSGEPGQISSQGARPNSNSYVVDGISANNAVSGGGWPSFLPGSKLPSLTALGTTHDLALIDSILEVHLHQQSSAPEFGFAPGAIVAIRTRSGTNEIHGSLFQSLRPDQLAANDWFDNRFGLGHNVSRIDNQGFSFGGPLRRDRTFFFLAGERLRLQQTYTWTATVPSLAARELAPVSLQPLFAQFPLPNGPNLTFGLSEYVASVLRPAGLEAMNLRLDHAIRPATQLFLRLSETPSSSESGTMQVNRARYRNSTGTLGLTLHTSAWTHDTRLGFSRTSSHSTWVSNSAQAAGTYFSQYPSFAADFSSVAVGGAGSIAAGEDGTSRQDQFQFSHSAAFRTSHHALQLGVDWFRLHPERSGATSGMTIAIGSPTNVYLDAAPIWVTYSAFPANSLHLDRISGYAQDAWRVTPNLTVTYGLRWLHAASPRMVMEPNLYQVDTSNGQIRYQTPAPEAPIWHARPVDLDPDASVAWRVPHMRETVLRVSWATIHDPSFGVATDQLNATPYLQLRIPQGLVSPTTQFEAISLGFGFARNLRLPVSRRWSASLQRNWTAHDQVSVSYLSLAGDGLLRREVVMLPLADLGQISFASNDGASSYHALNVLYRRSLSAGLSVTASYSWSHSIDLGSADSALYLISPHNLPAGDRGSSDFDVRHSVRGAVSYAIPSVDRSPGPLRILGHLVSHWTLGAVLTARAGFPVDVLVSESLNGFAVANYRPDLTLDVPLSDRDPGVANGYRLNSSAFRRTQESIGGLGRNIVSGIGMWQADTAIERALFSRRSWRLTLRGEAYNVFNHPEFADPIRYLSNPLFGQSSSPLNLMMGSGSPSSGQAPAFQAGGPRSVQISLRLTF
jgi:hypothetical protein